MLLPLLLVIVLVVTRHLIQRPFLQSVCCATADGHQHEQMKLHDGLVCHNNLVNPEGVPEVAYHTAIAHGHDRLTLLGSRGKLLVPFKCRNNVTAVSAFDHVTAVMTGICTSLSELHACTVHCLCPCERLQLTQDCFCICTWTRANSSA